MQDDKTEKAVGRKNIKPELIALGLLLPLALVLAAVLFRLPNIKEDAVKTITDESGEIAVENSANKALTPVRGEQNSQQDVSANTQTVSLEITGPSSTDVYEVAAGQNENVAQILEKAKSQGLQLRTKDYGGTLGVFVESINGTDNDAAKNLYWQLYVNDRLTPTGASTTMAAPGDRVTWKYEAEKELK
ncbi:MAG: DUF4430 domain-containing protein [Candidatus Andersenbacteria bacterium]|nr:DUF4430 domain-containing protein [bacterium]MDZ4225312.1 DUF4430 domain-containing protein [Candidatus Andersenbacteria bacterium]